MSVNIVAFGNVIDGMMSKLTSLFGYSYFIMKFRKGQFGPPETHGNAKGLAQLEGDGYGHSEVPMTMGHRVEVASCSKTITAIAVLKLLAESGHLTLESPIYPFLPHDWSLPLGSRSRKITFRHLLEHTSALPEKDEHGVYSSIHSPPLGSLIAETGTGILPGSLYKSMKRSLELGPVRDVPDPQGRLYKNINYSLFRIIVPYVRRGIVKMNLALDLARKNQAEVVSKFSDFVSEISADPALLSNFENFLPDFAIDPNDAPMSFKTFLGSEYVTYVRDNVLSLVGIPDADVNVTNPFWVAHCYDNDDPGIPGTTGHPEPLLNCGATGWKLSAQELCMVAAKLVGGGYSHEIWNKMKLPSPLNDPKHLNVIGLSWPDFAPAGTAPVHLGKSGSYVDAKNETGSRAGWRVFQGRERDGGYVSIVAALVANFNKKASYDAYSILDAAHGLASFETQFQFENF
jgi:hypothetical protein